MSARPTHFLCLPLVNKASLPALKTSLAKFLQDKAVQHVSNNGQSTGVSPPRSVREAPDSDIVPEKKDGSIYEAYLPARAIRPVETLHLTLGVMHLKDKARIEAASDFLKGMDVKHIFSRVKPAMETSSADTISSLEAPKSTKATSIKIYLKGLHSMQPSNKARVLYAEPFDPSDRVLAFCNAVRDRFIQAGYIMDEGRELKLHATIVNTIYAPKVRQGSKKRNLEFDARDLIDRWKNEIWAEIDLTKLAICEMGAKEDVDGVIRYLEVAQTEL